MVAYTRKGSYQHSQIEALKKTLVPELEIQFTAEPEIETLKSNSKAGAYVNSFVYLDAVKNKVPVVRHPALDGPRESFHFLLPKNSGWLEVFNEFLKDYVGSTLYKEEMVEHFGMAGYKMLAVD